MRCISDTAFLFICGVEGSGTTLLARILGSLPAYMVLGGNVYSKPRNGYDTLAVRTRLNTLTELLWADDDGKTDGTKKYLARKFFETPVLDGTVAAVYKRSFPFGLEPIFPCIEDLYKVHPRMKIIVIKRNLAANAASMLRRGFVPTIEAAVQRVKTAVTLLNDQVLRLPRENLHIIDFDELTRNPEPQLESLGVFVPHGEHLPTLSHLVKSPTSQGQHLQDINKDYLQKELANTRFCF